MSTDDSTTVASTLESRGFSPVTKVPENSVNLPFTLLTIRWRTLNPTSEWVGSMAHAPGM